MSYGPALFQMLLPDAGMRLHRASKAKLRGVFFGGGVILFFKHKIGASKSPQRKHRIF